MDRHEEDAAGPDGGEQSGPSGSPDGRKARRAGIRPGVWLAIGITVAGGAVLETLRLSWPPGPSRTPAPQTVLYGQPMRFDGRPAVCSEYVLQAGRWSCVGIHMAVANVQVVTPERYHGPCTHLRADTTEAAWVCLGDDEAPDELAPPPVGTF